MISNNENSNGVKGKMDLIYFLRFLWKWKLIIITGTAIFILVSAITSCKAPKLYSVEMIIKPGIFNISNSGKIFYIDDPQTIVSLINWGLFKKNIKEKIKQANSEANFVQTRIRATPKKKTNIIVVRYKAQSAKIGEKILNILIEELSNYYSNVTISRGEEYKEEISDLQSKIKISKIHEKNILTILEHLQKRTSEFLLQIDITEKKIKEVISLSNLKNTTEDNSQVISLQSLDSSLYQLINLKNYYLKQIDVLKKQETDEKNKLTSMRENKYRKLEQIARLNKQIGEIVAIRIISSPKSNKTPIKVNIYLNIILSAVSGFIATILLSLIIDFLISKKSKMYSQNK